MQVMGSVFSVLWGFYLESIETALQGICYEILLPIQRVTSMVEEPDVLLSHRLSA